MSRTKNTTVYCPTGVPLTEKSLKFVPRISTFDDKRIGLLWNGKPNGDFFLKRVGELLERRYKNTKITRFWEVDPKGSAHPDKKSNEVLDFVAKNSDVVISAAGD